MNKKVIVLFLMFVSAGVAYAQDSDKIKFGAYGRALQQNSQLGGEDTLNIDNTSRGHVMVDLGININPDKRTEIQAIMRLRSDLGGFFGAGSAAQLRQLYVKGTIGKFLNYQVGDLYLQLSPYTFYNNGTEGSVNEGRIFSDFRRDYTNYENLSNRGNYWWQQGAHTNFALAFKESIVDTVRVDGFFLRNRSADFISVPTTFHAGGKITITQSEKLKIAANYVNLFEVGKTIQSEKSTSNPVSSLQADYTLWNNSKNAFSILAEGGYSQLVFKGDSVKTKQDYFYDAGAKFHLKPANLMFTATYTYVGPEFFSSAAQTKRINFNNTPTNFPIYGNDPLNPNYRTANIFDLVRDTAIYNAGITRQLMAYDPTLSNAQPYGKATPNRTGVNLDVQYKDSAQKVMVNVNGSYLTDVTGEGSSRLRTFMVLKAGMDLHIHKFINFKKRIILTSGIRYENTNRGGDSLERVNLNSTLIDLGLELEVFNKLDLLVGSKILNAKGNEFITVRNGYNDIINFDNSTTANINVNQNLLAFGLKYRFSNNTYLTVQNHMFTYNDKNNKDRNYSINQFLILFNMNF